VAVREGGIPVTRGGRRAGAALALATRAAVAAAAATETGCRRAVRECGVRAEVEVVHLHDVVLREARGDWGATVV
jgi:hypothetical protein